MQHQHLSTYNPFFSEHILGNSFNKHWKWRKMNKTAVNLALHMSNESWISYTVLFFTIRTEDFAEIQDILSNDIHGILARIYLREATSYRWHISITIRNTVTLILHCYILQTKEGKACGFKGIMGWIISNFLRKEFKKYQLTPFSRGRRIFITISWEDIKCSNPAYITINALSHTWK